ncbi:MAG: hypothetical protein IIW17_04100 [Clostridia bacterium]|nr:hypothetical protein [Clostridia bacterium]
MQEQNTMMTNENVTKPKIRAQKKDIVLFAVACAIFAISWILQLVGVIGLPLYFLDLLSNSNIPGGAAIVHMLAIMALPASPIVVMEVMSILWAIGLIPTGILKRRKSELPRRMKNAVEKMFDINMVMMAIGLGVFLITCVVALISHWVLLV